jgi:hypothetical protein
MARGSCWRDGNLGGKVPMLLCELVRRLFLPAINSIGRCNPDFRIWGEMTTDFATPGEGR